MAALDVLRPEDFSIKRCSIDMHIGWSHKDSYCVTRGMDDSSICRRNHPISARQTVRIAVKEDHEDRTQ